MGDELCQYSAARLTEAYRARRISPVEVASAVLARVERLNTRFNAFCHLDAEMTLVMARQSETRWLNNRPLGSGDGIPTTIKDNMHVVGWPRRCGSLTIDAAERSSFDSACVARLREAGCVFLGKTTTPEFAWKGVTDSPLNGVTGNPWNRALTAGGSSGGAAVAARLGMGVWHAASDAAGSIRIPAAFCGIQGFKPTFGVVPNFPASAFSSLGHHGPLAREVADLAAMTSIMARPDRRDATAAPADLMDFSRLPDDGLRGKRIGYVKGGVAVDAEIGELMHRALLACEALGASVEEVALDLAGPREQIEAYWRVGCALLVESIPPADRGLVDPALVEKGELGRALTATEFRTRELERETFAATVNLLHERYDFLATPAVPVQPFAASHDVPPGSDYHDWIDWAPYSYPFNLTQQPAVAVACGLTRSGLPAALQIVGPRFSDVAVLAAAKAFETACPPPVLPLP